MSTLVANFKQNVPKASIDSIPNYPMINQHIEHTLENFVDRLGAMNFQSTFDGTNIQINEPSKEVIETMIHENIINNVNSGTLKDFLTNFYEPNDKDVDQLNTIRPGPRLNIDMLKQFWNPTTPLTQGINLTFPGSADVLQERARLSAYIILWHTIIESKVNRSTAAGGRKRLSGLRRSASSKRKPTSAAKRRRTATTKSKRTRRSRVRRTTRRN